MSIGPAFMPISMAQVPRWLDRCGDGPGDERRFVEPDRFDVTRNPTDHLSFGRGVHRCVGAGLAQEEIKAVLDALADRVERFDVIDRSWRRNNAQHGLERLTVSVT
jgi:cytochrome P450